jgi:hypothetical protein
VISFFNYRLLSQFVGMKSKNQLEQSVLRKCTALLSVLVLAFTVSIELAHAHASDAARGSNSSQSHCSICAVGHSPALATHVGSVDAPRRSQAIAIATAPQWSNRLEVAASYIRPPPVL